jgi:hypothetical protein
MTMESIHLKARVGPDGKLSLELPTQFRETDLEVLVVLQPVHTLPSEQSGWPTRFFEETFGSLENDPLVRLPQGEAELREPLQ